MISQFQKDYRWLSNFAPVKILLGNKTFPSVEHAYMSMKSVDNEWKNFCSDKNNSPGKVKRESRKITIRPDWNDDFRLRIMEDLLRMKFNQEPYKTKLISTGNQNIQEGNDWNDKFFGICLKTGIGENHLGRLIMKIRDELIISSKGDNNAKANS